MNDYEKLEKYEGERVEDGEYKLGQLSMPRYGRVVIPNTADDLLYNDMPVHMDYKTFVSLFKYVKDRDGSIKDFTAVVKNHAIVHVY